MESVKKVIYQETRPYFFNIVLVFLLRFATIGLEAFSPWPFKLLIDNVLDGKPLDAASFFDRFLLFANSRIELGYIVVGLFLISNILLELAEYLYNTTLRKLTKNIMYEFSRAAFANISHFDFAFFRKQEIGDYIYRLSYDVSAIGTFLEDVIIPLFSSSLYLMITAGIMAFIDLRLTVIALAVLPFLAFGLYLFNERITKVTKRSESQNSDVFSFIQQALSQLKIIQAFSREKHESTRFNEKLHSSLNTDFTLDKLNFGLTLLVGVIIAVSYSLIIIIGFNDVLAGELTTGLLIVFIFYLDDLTAPILGIVDALSTSKETTVKIERMDDFFHEKTKIPDNGRLTEIKKFNIDFENVTLKGNEDAIILDGVTAHIPEKKLTVIVGISGSGKTSVVSLIPRLYGDPQSGDVSIGNHNVRDYSLDALRHHIAYVPQESQLFNDTIHNVIAYGKEDATLEEVYHAARLADAYDFIVDMPHGFDTRVGEEGNFLSGGQRQRLTLARAFIRNAPIMILDEPLAFLDIKTRERIWKNIQRFATNKTVIVVSNIVSIISDADHVILMNRGKVAEEGKHSNLQHPSDLYKLIVKEN